MVLHCARLKIQMVLPSLLVHSSKSGLVDPRLRASDDINAPSKLACSLSGMGADWSPTARVSLARQGLGRG
jgi:hypothetical protein